MAKKQKAPNPNCVETSTLGIPEKLTETVPVKIGVSLKKMIPKPQSTWIRNLVIEKLREENE